LTNQISRERIDHAEIIKTIEDTKLKRKTDNLTHEKIEARNEVKLVWKEKDEEAKGGLISDSFFTLAQISKHGCQILALSTTLTLHSAHFILFEKKIPLLST
jgi:HSP90 family molecular chaperone